jgi:cell division septum initiation protein DivIVA
VRQGTTSRTSEKVELIRTARFPRSVLGYRSAVVDRFLRDAADWVEQAVAAGPDGRAVKREVERLADRTAHVLGEAEQAARAIRIEAREEVERVRGEADDYSQGIRQAAEAEAQKLRVAAGREVEEVVAGARAKADQIVEEAIQRRNRLNGVIEQLVQRRAELLDDAGSLADELAALVATHAEFKRTADGPAGPDPAAEAVAEETRDMGLLDPD